MDGVQLTLSEMNIIGDNKYDVECPYYIRFEYDSTSRG